MPLRPPSEPLSKWYPLPELGRWAWRWGVRVFWILLTIGFVIMLIIASAMPSAQRKASCERMGGHYVEGGLFGTYECWLPDGKTRLFPEGFLMLTLTTVVCTNPWNRIDMQNYAERTIYLNAVSVVEVKPLGRDRFHKARLKMADGSKYDVCEDVDTVVGML